MVNDPLNLDESGEWAGVWWLPSNPEEQVPGILRYDQESGLELSLIGMLDVRDGSVIHGDAGQRKFTLLDCASTFTERSPLPWVKSPGKQKVGAIKALLGAYVSESDEAAFSEIEISVEDLGLWSAASLYENSIGYADGKLDGTGHISVTPVEAQSVVVDGTEFRLERRIKLPHFDQRRGGTVARTGDTAFIRIVPPEPFPLAVALESASLVQDLIAVATHRAAGVIWLRMRAAGDRAAPSDARPVLPRYVDVLYAPSVLGKTDAKGVDHRQVFFTCETLPFEEVIPRWCEAHGRLQAATNMILGLRYAPARYVENNLLTAVGAAEVLHRRLGIDEKPFSREVFRAMREAMLDQVPEEHRDRFKGSIRNDPTLRDRLYALAARPDPGAIAQLVPDVDRWARRATRARNDLAHEGTTPNHSIEELFAVVEVTAAVVILNVLHELGLPGERQREIVNDHPQLRATARASRQWLMATDSIG